MASESDLLRSENTPEKKQVKTQSSLDEPFEKALSAPVRGKSRSKSPGRMRKNQPRKFHKLRKSVTSTQDEPKKNRTKNTRKKEKVSKLIQRWSNLPSNIPKNRQANTLCSVRVNKEKRKSKENSKRKRTKLKRSSSVKHLVQNWEYAEPQEDRTRAHKRDPSKTTLLIKRWKIQGHDEILANSNATSTKRFPTKKKGKQFKKFMSKYKNITKETEVGAKQRPKRKTGKRMSQYKNVTNKKDPTGPKQRPKRKRMSFRLGAIGKQEEVTSKPVLYRRDSGYHRVKDARNMFTENDKNSEITTSSTCPGCKKLVYANEREEHLFQDNEYWHSTCLNKHRRQLSGTDNMEVTISGLIADELRQTESVQKDAAMKARKAALRVFRKKERTASKENMVLVSKCPKCENEVLLGEQGIFYGNFHWHDICFRCKNCDKKLQSTNFKGHEGQPWCFRCYEDVVLIDFFENADIAHIDQERISYININLDESLNKVTTGLRTHKLLAFTTKIIGKDKLTVDEVLFDWQSKPQTWPCEIPKSPRSLKAKMTTKEQYSKFLEMLMTDRCNVAGTYITYGYVEHTGHVSRIWEKFVVFVWLPDALKPKEKILYGTGAGAFHIQYQGIGKVVTARKKEDLEFDTVIAKLKEGVPHS